MGENQNANCLEKRQSSPSGVCFSVDPPIMPIKILKRKIKSSINPLYNEQKLKKH